MKYPKYYSKDFVSICRNTDTTGILVEIPDSAFKKFPLIMTEVTYPDRERFDERIVGMTESTKELFEDSVKMFCGRVQIDIDRPLTERSIKKELEKIKNIGAGGRPIVPPSQPKSIIQSANS